MKKRTKKRIVYISIAVLLVVAAVYGAINLHPVRPFDAKTDFVVTSKGEISFNGTATNMNLNISIDYRYPEPMYIIDTKLYFLNATFNDRSVIQPNELIDTRLINANISDIRDIAFNFTLTPTPRLPIPACVVFVRVHFDLNGPISFLDYTEEYVNTRTCASTNSSPVA